MKTLKTILLMTAFFIGSQLNAQYHQWEEDEEYGYEDGHHKHNGLKKDHCCDISRRDLRSLAIQKRKLIKTKRWMLQDGYLDRREVRILDKMQFKLNQQKRKAYRSACRHNSRH